MAQVIIFDPDSTPVANRVTRFIPSANTPEYEGRQDVLINPVLPEGFEVGMAKVANGSVVNMTAQDLSTIASYNLDRQRASRWFGKSPTFKLRNTIEPLL